MAHGNITHHFGSAANLQAAVANQVIDRLIITVRTGVLNLRAGRIDEQDLIDTVFDWCEETGVGRLIGWLVAQRSKHLTTLYARFADLPAAIEADETEQMRLTRDDLATIVCSLVIATLGHSLIGVNLSATLGSSGHRLPPSSRRGAARRGIWRPQHYEDRDGSGQLNTVRPGRKNPMLPAARTTVTNARGSPGLWLQRSPDLRI
ncbi:hypothetical protein [Acidisoma sp.]|uniref:hypothetical protein n=1 Tax=Acidisoma sp. TaxID=1872115 RepID=UPI003B00BDBA